MSKEQEKQFESLYQQYQPMVQQMCLGYVKGDADAAADLCQEVFLNCWRALAQFRAESGYKTWVYRITVNTCLQHIRKEKRSKNREAEFGADFNPTQTSEQKPEEHMNQKLYQAIGQLKEVDRLLIMMVLEEQDYDDISEILGINPINLRVKIHRVKKRLQKLLSA